MSTDDEEGGRVVCLVWARGAGEWCWASGAGQHHSRRSPSPQLWFTHCQKAVAASDTLLAQSSPAQITRLAGAKAEKRKGGGMISPDSGWTIASLTLRARQS